MRKSKRELQERWMARAAAPATTDQPVRDELNLRKSRRGPPPGNRNHLIHGAYTRERLARAAEARTLAAMSKLLVALCDFGSRRPGGTQRLLNGLGMN